MLDLDITAFMMLKCSKYHFLRHAEDRWGTRFLRHPSLIRTVADRKCLACPYYLGHVMFYLTPFYQVYEKPLSANNS